jgi:hypothetical protein
MGSTSLPSSDFAKVVLGNRALEQLTPMMAETSGKPSGNNPTEASNGDANKETVQPNQIAAQLPPEFVTRFREGVEAFVSFYNAESLASQEKRVKAEELTSLLAFLSVVVRDAWSGIRRLAKRRGFPNAFLAFYKMPLGKDSKVRGSSRGWLEMGETLKRGNEAAVTAGFPEITNPDKQELEEALTAASTAAQEADDFALAHKRVQEQLQQNRLAFDDLIRELAANLRHGLRDKPSATRRDIMRSFGFLFNDDSPPAPTPEVIVSESSGLVPLRTQEA